MPVEIAAKVCGRFVVEKSDDALQMIFGWANVAVETDGTPVVDWHRDIIPAEELELAAYDFVLSARASGEDHDENPADGMLVESMMFTAEKRRALAVDRDSGEVDEAVLEALEKALPDGWWVGFYLPDAVAFERSKTEKTMFSIQGTAIAEAVGDAA